MDAIVIACTTRDHVNLLNNEAAHSKHNANRYQLQRKLRRFEKRMIDGKEREKAKEFLKPWDSFATDTKQVLENIIVSFKQNLRVINKTTNSYQHFDQDGKKVYVKQTKGDSWAIRKSMHKDTVFGEVNLRMIKTVSLVEALRRPERIVNKDFKIKVIELLKEGRDAKYIKKYVEENKDIWSDINLSRIGVYYFTKETKDHYYATRFLSELTAYFAGVTKAEDALKKVEAITDTGIQKILKAHLQAKENNPELAFSPDGIDEMNRNIVALNGGRFHQPIYKIRRFEKGNKFAIGQTGNKTSKYVEADKGTNLFFAVFGSKKMNKETGEAEIIRSYMTIPLNVMIDCQKKYGAKWRISIEAYLKGMELVADDAKLLFILSPNDLVYLTKQNGNGRIGEIDKRRIFKVVSFTANRLYSIPYPIAKCIVDKLEYSQLNKVEFTDNKESIKEICVPLIVDRLGNIISFNNKSYD
jgi:CRISPR-associated endonuclease Csn1